MAIRVRRLRELQRLLPLHSLGNGYQVSRSYQVSRWDVNSFALTLNSSPKAYGNFRRNLEGGARIQRYSTASNSWHEPLLKVDLLSFIESTLDEPEGPYHCWLNKVAETKDFNWRDGVFLVLARSCTENFIELGDDFVVMLEKVKSLQQRYPSLNVIGFQCCSSISSDVVRTCFLQITLSEYITFPILLSTKASSEMTDGACYIISKGLKSPPILYNKDVDLGIIDKAIKELNVHKKPSLVHNTSSTWVKPIEVIKEPELCSSMRNLLLYFPGCISVDEVNDRLFLSDVNHHRIIVSEYNGKILDCIGSYPGFEDGEFESSKLTRPAASFYDAAEDSLYFVDSENHAIRRADMERRVVETVYPRSKVDGKISSFWSWITDKLWMKRRVATSLEEFDSRSFLFPWHLIKSSGYDLFVLNHSFETLWIMDLASGAIKEVVNGRPKILEICGQMILERSSLLKEVPSHLLQQQSDPKFSLEGIPHAGLMSSVAIFQEHVVVCDTVGQMVLKLSEETGLMSSFRFSNFGILGLPYWLSFSLESVCPAGNAFSGVQIDHVQHLSLLPGRIDIRVNVDIPEDTELVEPLQEGCIWRQARGTAAEVSGAASKVASSEKVGVAQRWYDDLDSLASLTQEMDMITEEDNSSDGKPQDGKICIDVVVSTSPGTCEVVVCAALYLRMKRSSNSREKQVARIADILNPGMSKCFKTNACMQLLSASERDVGELVFVRPLHVRLQIDCLDHPKAHNLKDIILTHSSIDVNVLLK